MQALFNALPLHVPRGDKSKAIKFAIVYFVESRSQSQIKLQTQNRSVKRYL